MLFDITTTEAVAYLRIDEADLQEDVLNTAMDSAEQYIKSYTGLTEDEIEEYPDIKIAFFALVQDMYDNRGVVGDGKSSNKTVESILGMHVVNLV